MYWMSVFGASSGLNDGLLDEEGLSKELVGVTGVAGVEGR